MYICMGFFLNTPKGKNMWAAYCQLSLSTATIFHKAISPNHIWNKIHWCFLKVPATTTAGYKLNMSVITGTLTVRSIASNFQIPSCMYPCFSWPVNEYSGGQLTSQWADFWGGEGGRWEWEWFHPGYNPRRHLSGKTHWWWIASYHGKYSTKRRSHILICDCF